MRGAGRDMLSPPALLHLQVLFTSRLNVTSDSVRIDWPANINRPGADLHKKAIRGRGPSTCHLVFASHRSAHTALQWLNPNTNCNLF